MVNVRLHFDGLGQVDLILDPQGSPAEEQLLDLALRGQHVLVIKKKENNGGSWVLSLGKPDKLAAKPGPGTAVPEFPPVEEGA